MQQQILILLTQLIAGMLFGLGLGLSDMINPARVIAFLDITGQWDATLMFVMLGALTISLPVFQISLQKKPVLSDKFKLPTKLEIDNKLLSGAMLFGIGWGLGGFCPGPAIAALSLLSTDVFIFVISMFIGFYLAQRLSLS